MELRKVMLISMVTNIFLALLKVIVGFLGKSSALIADGIHSFSDLITDVQQLSQHNIGVAFHSLSLGCLLKIHCSVVKA